MRGWPLLVVLAGCAETHGAPCESMGSPDLDAAPADVPFGGFIDGDPLPVGNPPQGGAPYTPLHARVDGLVSLREGVEIELHGVDLEDGAVLGELSTPSGLVCANVGDSAGRWIVADLHFRYFGWTLADLPGRFAEISVLVRDVEGNEVETALTGVLESM
jgi:hypothetical protein